MPIKILKKNNDSFKKVNLIFASFFFSLMTVCVKKIDNTIPAYELVFFRSLLSLLITSWIINKYNDFVFKNNGKCNANHLNKKTCMCVNHYKCNFIPMWLSIKPNAL